MKRDMELIHQLLIAISGHPRSVVSVTTKDRRIAVNRALGLEDDDDRKGHLLDVPLECTTEELDYHLSLMEEAELLAPCQGPPFGIGPLYTLSWYGHEYLAEIQQDGVLPEMKSRFGDAVWNLSLTVLRTKVSEIATELIGRGL